MRIRVGIAITLAFIVIAGCENVFTTSLLSGLQRDPSTLSAEQQVRYAEEALASGDPEAMADAYATLRTSDDPETQLLAADLAIGAAGLETTITATLGELAGGGDPETILGEALATFDEDDLAMLADAAALLAAASDDGSVTPSPEQYAFAAVALVAVEVAANDGDLASTTIPPQAEEFLEAAAAGLQESGQTTDLLEEIGAAVGWTPS